MNTKLLFVLMGLAAPGGTLAQEASVMHWLTSESEAAALSVFAKAYSQAGGTWIDRAVPDFDTALASGTSSIINGTAPVAMMFNAGSQLSELAANGLILPVQGFAEADGWADQLSPALKDLISYDGQLVALPFAVQAQLWMFTSTKAYEVAGMSPPQTWEEFIASLDTLSAAGITPVAQGGEGWQDIMTLEATLLYSGKVDLFKALFVDGDIDALRSERFLEAAEDFKTIAEHLDAGSPGRKWNDATAMVVSGQAAVNFMGDWALPAFADAGMTPGKDFGCFLGIGENQAYVAVSDVFVLPVNDDAADAQALFAKTIMAPATLAEFSAVKPALPPRLDVTVSSDNSCTQKAMTFLSAGGEQLITPASTLTPDRYGAVADVVSQALHTPDVDAQQMVDGIISAIEATEY